MRTVFSGLGVTLLLASASIAAAESAENRGRVCLASVTEPTTGRKSLHNSSGGNPKVDYVVQIDGGSPVALTTHTVNWVSDLDLKKQHRVVIRSQSKKMQADFGFRFDDFKFKNPKKADLCLFLNDLYLTWQLWEVERTGKWCACWNTN